MSETADPSDPLRLMRDLHSAQARWIAQTLSGEGLQAVDDARRLLARAIDEQNDAMIRVYSEACLLLLEANKRNARQMLGLLDFIAP